ncbi:hypothetical protein Plec18170_007786 [Paecilomyces lecythidis]
MPAAKGRISGANKNFEGHWEVDGHSLVLSGSFHQSLGKWSASPATLKYDNLDDLTGTYVIDDAFQPYIGGSDLILAFKNESNRHIMVGGSLEDDHSGRIDLTGQGVWEFSQSD